MLINYVPGEECRIAIVEDGRLEEFYQERASTESHVSNIYKGRVTNVEPAIQAAFVDFGLERNGFLHITDLHPKYFPGKDREEFEKVGHKTARHERPPIQKCLKRGQEVLVQVLKEGIGTKGPTLTSYLSIPGRFLVMMPDMQRLGVSRKVEDDDARRETRDILKALDPPKEFGFIVRTAGIGQTKTDLKRDLSYLQRLWKNIERKRKGRGKTGELYAESDLVIRTIRDVFNSDIERIVIDDATAARRAQDFLSVANPRTKSKVVYYDDPVPLFHRMGIEPQLDNMNAREVPLPSGGALVIDQTEALVAVDVNSGKSRAARDAETNAYKTNLEAVDEIARQLRLRDLGGLVVLDLIDMRPAKNRKAVETRFRNNLKKDRARTRVGPISQFGLLELTRQRMRASLKKSIHQECKHCVGRGYSMSPESVVLSVMRRLALVMTRDDVERVELTISPDVAFHILNRKRSELVELERTYGKAVMVRVGGGTIDFVDITALNDRGVALPGDIETTLKKIKAPTDTSFRDVAAGELPEPEEEDASETEGDDTPETAERSGEAETTTPDEPTGSDTDDDQPSKRKRRRRRRGGRGRKNRDEENQGETESSESSEASPSASDEPATEQAAAPESKAEAEPRPDEDETAAISAEASEAGDSEDGGTNPEDGTPKKKRRRRRRRKNSGDAQASDEQATSDESPSESPASKDSKEHDHSDEPAATAEDNPEGEKPKRSRRRGSRAKKNKDDAAPQKKKAAPAAADLPLDEFGDVDGNVKPGHEKATDTAQPADGDAPAKKPRSKPGRGYSNRLVTG
jgi:ribonuclease E